ncbi:MAG: TlpA family protein disulfide reductase [Firmicutes bacterium]|nr:TlpA family protein disulfide reductase [Bacillota bacterium]
MRSFLLLPLLATSLWASNPRLDALVERSHWVKDAWPAHKLLLNQPAPRLDLREWLNGEVTPAQMKGKIVLIDFWATWCGPCRRAIPHNNQLAKKYAAKGVVVMGVCGGGRDEQMAKVAKECGATYPNARMSEATQSAWKVQYWPTYAVVDRKGMVRAIGVEPDAVEAILDLLLQEQP